MVWSRDGLSLENMDNIIKKRSRAERSKRGGSVRLQNRCVRACRPKEEAEEGRLRPKVGRGDRKAPDPIARGSGVRIEPRPRPRAEARDAALCMHCRTELWSWPPGGRCNHVKTPFPICMPSKVSRLVRLHRLFGNRCLTSLRNLHLHMYIQSDSSCSPRLDWHCRYEPPPLLASSPLSTCLVSRLDLRSTKDPLQMPRPVFPPPL